MNVYRHASGICYFRTTIPKDLIDIKSPKELHISLRTFDITEAQKIADELKSTLKSHYIFLRSNNLPFRRDKSIRSTGNIVSDLVASLKVGNTEVTIKSAINEQDSFSKLVQLVLSLNQGQQLPLVQQAIAPATVQPIQTATHTQVEAHKKSNPLAYDVYLEYREIHTKKSSPNTAVTYNSYSPYIQYLLKGLYLNSIKRADVAKIREDVMKLPTLKYNRHFYEQNLSLEDLDPDTQIVSPRTATYIFSIISAFYAWCVRCCKVDNNPFSGVKVDTITSPTNHSNVTRYTSEQLKTLFEGERFDEYCCARSFKYWGPLISLYTGMRVAEVGQLHVADVFVDKNGRYYLSVNKESFSKKLEKTVKNAHSVRIVPLPSKLVNLGFGNYLNTIKKEGYPILFPDLGITNHTLIATGRMSSEFCRYKRTLIKDSNSAKLNFHSLRHTFVAYLQHKQVTTSLIQQIVGHAHGTITLDLYGEPVDPSQLVSVIDSVDYDIDVVPWEDNSKQKDQRILGWRKIKEALG